MELTGDNVFKIITIMFAAAGVFVTVFTQIVKWSLNQWVDKTQKIKGFESERNVAHFNKLSKDIMNCFNAIRELKKEANIFNTKNKEMEMSLLKLNMKIQETLKNLADLNNRITQNDIALSQKVTDLIQKELFKLGKKDMI